MLVYAGSCNEPWQCGLSCVDVGVDAGTCVGSQKTGSDRFRDLKVALICGYLPEKFYVEEWGKGQ